MTQEIWCPRCNQGWVMDVRIIPVARDAFVCQECDALWFERDEIAATSFVDFGTFLLQHGGKGLWSELEVRGRARRPGT